MAEAVRRLAIGACWVAGAVLTGCGGGGGGGHGGASTTPVTGSWETAEYNSNYGLRTIHAASAYASGGTGSGVKVAVIDSGVDLDHPELAGRIDPASVDVVSGRTGGQTVQDQGGHGTLVAGVVAANRNSTATHGVAFNASVLALRTDEPGSCAPGCSYLYSDIARALDSAVARGARVINISLGSLGPAPVEFREALQRAVDAGLVVVASAGNAGAPQPEYPARLAADAIARGQVIAAGAVGTDGRPAAFSNLAGDAQSFYVMAPGVDVPTTALGGGMALASGTSFAAPHVAGAAALLISYAPHLTAQQVVQILMTSAADLGDPALYGNGLLDIAAALAPAGAMAVPLAATVDGSQAALSGSQLALGPAFGDAVARDRRLQHVLALDRYGRGYSVDMRDAVAPARPSLDLADVLASPFREEVIQQRLENGFSVQLAFREEPGPGELAPFRDERRLTKLALAGSVAPDVDLVLGHGVKLGALSGIAYAEGADGAPFLSADAFASPFLGFLAEPDGGVVSRRFSGGWSLRLGFASDGGADGQAALAELAKRFAGGGRLAFNAGGLAEDATLLASDGDGAFALDGARTGFAGVTGSWPIADKTQVIGQASLGLTRALESGGLLEDISPIVSAAWGIGIAVDDVAREGDRIAFALSRPLRVETGSAALALPVARTVDGTVERSSGRVSLEPSGNELDGEVVYRITLADDSALVVNYMLQLEPGHIAGAAPAHVVGVRWAKKL